MRNLGVAAGKLQSAGYDQLYLLIPVKQQLNASKIYQVIDDIRQKFGVTSLVNPSSLSQGGTMIQRAGLVGDHDQRLPVTIQLRNHTTSGLASSFYYGKVMSFQGNIVVLSENTQAFPMSQTITVRELSIFSGQPHSTTSRKLQRLKASKLIVSTINPLDTRSRVIKLSDDGNDLLDKIKKEKLSFLDRAFSEVPKSKIETISANLNLLTKSTLNEYLF